MRRFSALNATRIYWATGGRDLSPHTAKDVSGAFKPAPDRSEKVTEFKRWVDLFFIKQGGYCLAKKAYANFGKADDITVLKEDERVALARKKIAELIAEGKAEELYDQGMILRIRYIDWDNEQNRIAVMRKFVEVINDPTVISKLHFHEYGLSKLLGHYKGSVKRALAECQEHQPN
ncbi:hypothetical protein J4450_04430 [Candidatus Micrarchaeota archaeon]|nr:hypothetical protein [Candidatus Micrarchaeota archaeon]